MYQINAGSNTNYVDSQGETWEADTAYVTGGKTWRARGVSVDTTCPLCGDEELMLTERYGRDMAYALPSEYLRCLY